ncbi:MAG TPA: hypothetical protein VEC36_01670 [Patescibacteria group bacterium]|nr:hypothetical protein [Patescibacteria group bacterium]
MTPASKPVEIYNPYPPFIPCPGENGYSLSVDSGNTTLELTFDSEQVDGDDSKVKFIFEHVVMVDIVSFPGVSTISVQYDKTMLGSLVEFTDSSYTDAWHRHFNNMFTFKHFNILLLNQNKKIDIICEDVKITRTGI